MHSKPVAVPVMTVARLLPSLHQLSRQLLCASWVRSGPCSQTLCRSLVGDCRWRTSCHRYMQIDSLPGSTFAEAGSPREGCSAAACSTAFRCQLSQQDIAACQAATMSFAHLGPAKQWVGAECGHVRGCMLLVFCKETANISGYDCRLHSIPYGLIMPSLFRSGGCKPC